MAASLQGSKFLSDIKALLRYVCIGQLTIQSIMGKKFSTPEATL